METQRLLDAVAEAFAATGAGTASWPHPHPGGEGPLDEEYERCLDPGKYRILGARAEAWVQALTGLGLADVEEVADPSRTWRDDETGMELERAVRLRPHEAAASPLLLGFASLDGIPDAVIRIGAGDPAVAVGQGPACGCDACDDGSESLLKEFDEDVLAVVTGDFLHVSSPNGTISASGSGWSATGDFAGRGDIDALLSEAREGRSRHRVVLGGPWW
ncbi:DUF6226 family protein [Streptomyces albidus (ex Kaewkla and Franco 2022)]|uniref:DUF6226 family protein n=1 Tax=Streptomyces albidus (ex Kaewkla and Franco 2022) TaxID=722709 RepID=UPI0015EF6284|nr:DUF6226 family protein [Streptomyces albidus (ex Kaewkla and Franco 2022)]